LSQDHPKDAGLIANLAVAQLLNRDLPGATKSIAAALALDPNDPVSMALKTRIEEVASVVSCNAELAASTFQYSHRAWL
jgi:hypothetical protein